MVKVQLVSGVCRDQDPGFEIFTDPDPGFEIFADPDPNLDPGLIFVSLQKFFFFC